MSMKDDREERAPRAPPDPPPGPDGRYHMRYINTALGVECIITLSAMKPGAALYAGATMRSDWSPDRG